MPRMYHHGMTTVQGHCISHGGQLIGSDTLKLLGYKVALSMAPMTWPVYEALDRVEGMPPIYTCVGGAWRTRKGGDL